MRKLENDLTKGNVVKQLVLFAVPFLLSNLIQSFYNVADMLIVGRFCGTEGISAVNNGGQVTFLMTNIVIGLSVGGTIIIAQYMGANDREAVNESISTLLISLLVAALALTGIMLVAAPGILTLIKTPAEAYVQAREYLLITALGTISIFGYNALSAIIRGMGDSKPPLYFVTIACVLNVFLDILLVGPLHMGAKGAAIATIFSQAVSVILCIIYLKKNNFSFDFKLKSFHFYKNRFTLLMKIGIPTSVQNVVTNISFLFLTAMVNSLGVEASAAVGVVGKFNSFAILPAIAAGSSVSAMAAQNIGAGKIERAKKTMYTGIILAFSITIPIFILSNLFPGEIIGLFDDDPVMIQAGITYMRSFTFDYLIVPIFFCVNGIITAAGFTGVSSATGILSALGFRVPFAYLFGFVLNFGIFGIGLGAPVASIFSTLIVVLFYLSGRWKKSKIVEHMA